MPIELTDIEARILGSLVEKSFTTPDLYPLSLNSLQSACNQKTSRDPVMALDETTIARGLATLKEKNLVSPRSEPGSRVTKFAHRIENLLGGGTSKEIGIVCVLLLRGAQTPGEIRVRTDRICEFASVQEVEMILQEMTTRAEGPIAERLPRQPGQKEARYRHLFSPGAAASAQAQAAATPAPRFTGRLSDPSVPATPLTPAPTLALNPSPVRQLADVIGARFQALEQRIAYLEARLASLEPPSPPPPLY